MMPVLYLCRNEAVLSNLESTAVNVSQGSVDICFWYSDDLIGWDRTLCHEAFVMVDGMHGHEVQAAPIHHQRGRNAGSSTMSTCLFLFVELALLYAAWRIAKYAGLIHLWSVARIKEKLMEMIGIVGVSLHDVQDQTTSQEQVTNETESRTSKVIPSPIIAVEAKDINLTLPADPVKVAWANFRKAFHKRGAHEPFPSIEVASSISEENVEALLREDKLGIKGLLDDVRSSSKRQEIARDFLANFPVPKSEWMDASILLTAEDDVTYWAVGDVHAKLSAIAKICAVIADRHARGLTKKRNILILLGDFIDRGDEPLETLAFIEWLKLRPLFEGFCVITLKGNHDVGLSCDETGKYVSMVSPAETAEYFEDCKGKGTDLSLEVEAAMRLAVVSPRMCELTGIDLIDSSKTMLFVHGGVPHVDLQEKLYAVRNAIPQGEAFFEALSGESVSEELRKSCAEDFTWIRFARDLPVKQPNRGSRGCEIGTEDVAQYLSLHRVLTARDITFIFRGHDHERPGFACYSPHDELNPTKKKFAQRECNVLTLNAMEPDDSSGGMFRSRDLALAEWSLGNPVRLRRIITHHLDVTSSKPKQIVQSPAIMSDGGVPPVVTPEDLMRNELPATSAHSIDEGREETKST